MTKAFILLTVLFLGSGYAACSTVAESIRSEYASGMFDAFISQSYGKSTVAFYQFDVAREKAKKAKENPLKIIAMENLFAWYRMYASSMGLYYSYPTGNDRIIGEYHPPSTRTLLSRGAYRSEWGKNTEQARLMREFMLGVAEVISGVFCISVSSPLIGTVGGLTGFTLLFDGGDRIFTSLNSLWATHQAELYALKEWEQKSLKPAVQQ